MFDVLGLVFGGELLLDLGGDGVHIYLVEFGEYWNGRRPVTGITEPALLCASHLSHHSLGRSETDAKRLDVHNGLLLSALWDTAFDAGLISFADDRHRPPPSVITQKRPLVIT